MMFITTNPVENLHSYTSITGTYVPPSWEKIVQEWFTVTFIDDERVDIRVVPSQDWDDILERVFDERREAWNILAEL